MLKISLLLLLITAFASATTNTYLVYRKDNFPQDRYLNMISPQEYKTFIATGPQDIKSAKGQPSAITSYVISFDGKYALWTISTDNADELWHIDSMVKQGYIVLMSSFSVGVVVNPKGGKDVGVISSGDLMPMPTDFYDPNAMTTAEKIIATYNSKVTP